MLTALILLSIAIGLKHVGVDLPVIDKVIDFTKDKVDKIKTQNKTLHNNDLENPIKKENELQYKQQKPVKSYQSRVLSKTYSGNMKI